MEMKCQSCNQLIVDPICNNCRNKQVAFFLSSMNISPNEISHTVRYIRKQLEEDEDLGFCEICGEGTTSLCFSCYFSRIKNILNFYFPEKVINKFHAEGMA